MRLAALAKLEDTLDKRGGADIPLVERLTITDLPGFSNVDLSPSAATIAICGGTGAGKTAVIELLNHALAGTGEADAKSDKARFTGVTVSIRVSVSGNVFERSGKIGEPFPADPYAAGSTIVRISDRTDFPISVFRNPSVDLEALIDGVDSYLFEDDVREMLGHVCRRDYSQIEVFEVEAEGDTIIPYFRVTSAGCSYDSRSMATGELSSFYLAWKARTAQPSSFLLVEEPEAFLPPSAHRQMFGLLATWVVKSKLGFIVTTHSAEIASRLGKRHLFPLKQTAGQARILTTADSKRRVLYNLGLQPQRNILFLVEDEIAEQVLSELIAQTDFGMFSSFTIKPMSGFGPAKAAIDNFPDLGKNTPVLAILDGDVRPQAVAWHTPALYLFLPFDESMETEFLSCIAAKQPKFASLVARKSEHVTDALDAVAGDNDHDRFREFVRRLRLNQGAAIAAAVELWKKTPGKKAKLRRFATDLAAAVGVPSS